MQIKKKYTIMIILTILTFNIVVSTSLASNNEIGSEFLMLGTITIKETTKTGYDSEAGIGITCSFNNDYPILKFHIRVRESTNTLENVYSYVYTYNNYIADKVTSFGHTIYFKITDFSEDFKKGDTLVFLVHVYPYSIIPESLLNFMTKKVDYNLSLGNEIEVAGLSTTTLLFLLIFGVIAFVIIILVFKYLFMSKKTSW